MQILDELAAQLRREVGLVHCQGNPSHKKLFQIGLKKN
jgi:hypothetical protein